ncbi:MAG TPA: ABC transporter substrate-binding protein [Treponemataceae bacterium]|jgi:branched-chain amino acid transport system substrate-binding protein|nr:MAG: ABC transporter substrate-binding protein [Treponema sp.]HOC29456.1 ABC transporter substrate-binding protein [Treponemataceae bacterium]HPX46833.1 ABC transporter substrate-binding protein [Treponemataceae bacterium]HQL33009.1 ABC transporter substrate-binding protein [Treponemataceae bacterium]
MKKSFVLKSMLALVFVSVAVLGGCAKSDKAGKDAKSTIKIGGIFPLSGAVAVYGTEARNGVQLAVEEINAAGGINGQTVQLIAEDDEGNPEKSVSAYKLLTTRDGAKLFIGSLTSGCTMAITSLAQAQKVVVVAPAATAPAVTDAGNFIFRVCFIDPFQGKVGAKFAFENLGLKKAAVLYDVGNDYSVGLFDNFKAGFEAAGGTIVAAESYNTGDKDFNAQLTKIKNANPEVVYLPDYYSTVALIAKQLRAQGLNVPIVGADGWDGIVDNAGDEMLNGFYSNHYASDSTDGKVIDFVKKYSEKFNATPTSFAALAYDAMYVIKDAIIASGSADPVKVQAALEKTKGSYLTGNLSFDEKRNPTKSAVMLEIVKRDGKLVPVYKATVNP